jgi:hypothetical protein
MKCVQFAFYVTIAAAVFVLSRSGLSYQAYECNLPNGYCSVNCTLVQVSPASSYYLSDGNLTDDDTTYTCQSPAIPYSYEYCGPSNGLQLCCSWAYEYSAPGCPDSSFAGFADYNVPGYEDSGSPCPN